MHKFKINHAASLFFWLRANEIGVQQAILQFEKEGASSFVVEAPNWKEVLFAAALDGSEADLQELIATEIEEHLRVERQLTGPLYLDEITTGRSSEAKNVDPSGVLQQPVKIRHSGVIQSTGLLCLRHPLPAVVVASDPIDGPDVIRVGTTQAALGAEYPLFLFVEGCAQVDTGLYVLSGVFSIPAVDQDHSRQWDRLIQNSRRFLKEFKLLRPLGEVVDVEVCV